MILIRPKRSSIRLCRRIRAHGTFVQKGLTDKFTRIKCRVCDSIRMIWSLVQEPSCLNPVPGSPHSWVLPSP
ncbi:hypothetical protein EGM97_06420 [Pseudomonas sp. AF32]|nr:hypothetical protein [Pseudomonas sp. AF32]